MTLKAKTTKGEVVTLDRVIGQGGEAAIYTISETERLCAKIFKDPQKNSEKHEKVKTMISVYLQVRQIGGTGEKIFDKFLAWPRLRLFSLDSGEFIGFMMNKASSNDWSLDKIMNASKTNKISFLNHLLELITFLHSLDVVVGDVHEGNIVIQEQQGVFKAMLIDCDSYQIAHKHTINALQPEISPPEIKNGQYLTPAADVYTVAIFVYRLLMEGFSPFQFVREGNYDPELQVIKEKGLSPLRSNNLKVPPASPSLKRLPAKLKETLASALDPCPSNRPELDSIKKALSQVKDSDFIKPGKTNTDVICSRCGFHNYHNEIYCQRCAHSLTALRKCLQCAELIPGNVYYCPFCQALYRKKLG